MSTPTATAQLWPRPLVMTCIGIALSLQGIAFFAAAMWLPILGRQQADAPQPPAAFTPSPSPVRFGAAELPYTFVLPNGFAPSMNAHREDAVLVPEPWLPTTVEIRLSHHDLSEDASKLDPEALRRFARTAVRGWTFGEPVETLLTADGSSAFEYPADFSSSALYTLVMHRQAAVLVYTNGRDDATDAQRATLHAATHTLIRSIKFR